MRRIVTAARLRAVGILLVEALSLGLLISDRLGEDKDFKTALGAFLKKVRAL